MRRPHGIFLFSPPRLTPRTPPGRTRSKQRSGRNDHLSRHVMLTSLPVINLSTATYECIFGRGCDGICCQNGRPPVYPEEEEIIRKHLEKFLPELRPEARKLIEREGF